MPRNIPLGVIVAVVDLVDVWRTVDLLTDNKVGEVEMRYGNYLSGRFGWLFENIRALPDPVPYKGAQGLFNVPDELLA